MWSRGFHTSSGGFCKSSGGCVAPWRFSAGSTGLWRGGWGAWWFSDSFGGEEIGLENRAAQTNTPLGIHALGGMGAMAWVALLDAVCA
jgi:hypothetical protein